MKHLKFYIACISFILISLVGNTQSKKYLYFFDKNMILTTEPQSSYFGIGLFDNNAIQMQCFRKVDKHIVFTAHYTDSTLASMEGLFQSYYSNGALENDGSFVKGKEEGQWEKFDSTGQLIDSSIFKDGMKVFWGIFHYWQSGVLRSTVFYDYVNPKLDRAIYYDDKGNIVDLSTLKDTYQDKVFIKAEIEASFPGGAGAWTRYISTKIMKRIEELHDDPNSRGTCRVRFIVDKEGKVSEVEAITMQNTRLAKIAVDAVVTGPNWLPALQNGVAVNAYREQPISYNQIEQ
jgi:hypothetical protein